MKLEGGAMLFGLEDFQLMAENFLHSAGISILRRQAITLVNRAARLEAEHGSAVSLQSRALKQKATRLLETVEVLDRDRLAKEERKKIYVLRAVKSPGGGS